MFEKINKIRKLKKMQSALSGEKTTAEEKGVKATVNGKMEVEKIELNSDLSVKDQQKAIKKAVNKALKEIRTKVAQKMSQSDLLG